MCLQGTLADTSVVYTVSTLKRRSAWSTMKHLLFLAISISQRSSSTMGFSGQYLQPKTQFSVGTMLQKLCSPKSASLCLEGPALVMSSSCIDYASYLKMKTPVQFSSVAQLYSTWDFMDCSMPGFPVHHQLTDLQSSSVTLLCPTLCNPMDCSTPGLPVHHQLPEFTQTHVHQVSDAIQPSYPVIPFSSCLKSFPASFTMSLFPGSFPVSQFFASGGQSIGVSASASVLPMKSQDWFPLGWTGWISLQAKGLSRVFSNTTVQKHQFFSTQLSL